MKKTLLLILFYSILSNAQKQKINLPKGEEIIKVNSAIKFFSLYVFKDNSMILENEPISLGELGKISLYYKSKTQIEFQPFVRIHLYIDKDVNYNFVDKIKTQLASAGFYYIYHKLNSTQDKDIMSGIGFPNYQSFFKLKPIEKVLSNSQKRKNESLKEPKDEIMMIPPPPFHWSVYFKEKLYSDNPEAIKEILNERSYKCVEVTNKGFKLDNKEYSFSKPEKIKSKLKTKEVLILTHSKNLKYINYIKAIRTIKSLKLYSTEVVELSEEIIKIHKLSNIRICN